MTPTEEHLALASFDEIATELGRRYPQYALVANEQVLVDGTKFLERHGYQGNFNVLLGLLASLHAAVLERKHSETQVI
jgi:hypothetical protein